MSKWLVPTFWTTVVVGLAGLVVWTGVNFTHDVQQRRAIAAALDAKCTRRCADHDGVLARYTTGGAWGSAIRSNCLCNDGEWGR